VRPKRLGITAIPSITFALHNRSNLHFIIFILGLSGPRGE
jgi:hypothetical protein